MCSLMLAGCFGCAVGSTSVEPPTRHVATAPPAETPAPPPPTLICRWKRLINADGVSILKGNPKDKTLGELAAGALIFDSTIRGRIQCRRLDINDDSESGLAPTNPKAPKGSGDPVEL